MIEKVTDPFRKFREDRKMMENLTDPFKKFREDRKMMENLTDPFRQFRENRKMMENLTDPFKKFREQREALEVYLDPFKKYRGHQEAIEKLADPLKQLRDYRKQWLEISRSLKIPTSEISPLENGSITVSGDLVDTRKLSDEFYEISSNSIGFEDFNESISEWFTRLSRGAQYFVLLVLIPYITSVVAGIHTPMWEEFWNDYSQLPDRVAKREIIKDARELFSSDELISYRFTTASSLRVRQSGSIKSKQLDSISFGTVVRIKEKAKDWTHIEYTDSDSKLLKDGWVFSRYLRKFDK